MWAFLEQRVKLAPQVLLAHQAAQVMRVTQELPVFRADLDLLEVLVQQAQLAHQDPPAPLGWVLKETRVRLVKEVYQAWWDHQVLLDILDQWAIQALTGLLAKMEQRAHQGTLDCQVKREKQALQDRGVHQVKGGDRDLLEGEDTTLKMHSP